VEAAHVQPDPQDGLFDQVISDDLLVKALEKRHTANQDKSLAVAAFKDADDVVKGKVDALEIEPGQTVRCGRFRIAKSEPGDPVDVSFTRSPKPRLTISLLED
jgi:hypothetical protein